ncbi:MAG: Ig-like domain-containing protein, partial [Prevotella sp.]|nr:Ig-like domain-containing protein [Prevotella sp.]
MKRIIRQILGWGMMLTLPLMMTSCGELFDMLDNPITPALQVLRAQLTLKVGESKPIQASTQAHVVLLYSSDNPAVATVDATGLITAVSPGSARITIKAQGEDDYYRTEIFSENTTTVEVTVIPAKAAGSISFAAASVIKYKNDELLPNPLTIVGDGVVTYSSSNEGIATVDATTGEVTIIGFGSTNITATVTDGAEYAYKTKTVSYTLTVDPAINLAALSGDYIAQNGDVLTGTLAGNYKISIAENANVELKDVTINSTGVDDSNYDWAGLTCDG